MTVDKFAVWYFALPAPAVPEGPYEEGEHIVFVRHSKTPMWWREIARFRDKDRAKTYAEIENDCASDEDEKNGEDAQPAPVNDLPLAKSGLEKIAEIVAVTRTHPSLAPVDPDPLAGLPNSALERLPPSHPARPAADLPREERGKSKAKAKSPAPPKPGPTVWNVLGAEDRLRELRGRGLSYKVVAKRLADEFKMVVTSAMCSAKADRLKLPRIPIPGGRPKKIGGAATSTASVGVESDELQQSAPILGRAITEGPIIDDFYRYASDEQVARASATEPAQDAKIEETGQSGGGLDADSGGATSMVSSVDAGADPAVGTTSPLPSVREIMGSPPPDDLAEAVVWYRDRGHRVFKIKPVDQTEYKIQVDGGELMPAENFVAMVKDQRREEQAALAAE